MVLTKSDPATREQMLEAMGQWTEEARVVLAQARTSASEAGDLLRVWLRPGVSAMKVAALIQQTTEAGDAVADREGVAYGAFAMAERIRDAEARKRLKVLQGLHSGQSRDEELAAAVSSVALLAASAVEAAGRVEDALALMREDAAYRH